MSNSVDPSTWNLRASLRRFLQQRHRKRKWTFGADSLAFRPLGWSKL